MQMITSLQGVSCTMTFDLDLYLQCNSAVNSLWNCLKCHILSCPLYSTYRSGWIISIFGTNTNNCWHWKVCHTLRPLTLTDIFKLILLWRCLFHGLYSYVAPIQPMRGRFVTYHFQVNRSKSKSQGSFEFLRSGRHPSRSPNENF